MKSRIVATLVLLCFTALGAFAQAKFEVEGGETYDWGKTKPPEDGKLSATIKMLNTGDRPMKITEVKPGCGCTKTDPDKYVVEPGDKSTMDVKLNISPAQSGPITKSITIRWGDAEGLEALAAFKENNTPIPAGLDTTEHVAFLFLKADIQRAIMLKPSIYFSFQGLEVGKESEAAVTITNNSDEEITFSDWSTDNGLVINHSGKVKLAPGEELNLTAKVVPALKGQFSGLVAVKTTHPDYPTVEVRAYGFAKENESPIFQQNAK